MNKKILSVLISVFLIFSLYAQEKGTSLELPPPPKTNEEINSEMYDNLMHQVDMQNAELRTLREEYTQSLLDVKNAKAGYGPSIDLTVSGTYMARRLIDPIYLNVDQMLDAIAWPEGIQKPSSGQQIKLYDGLEQTYYNFQLEMLQPICTWGKITFAVDLYEEVAFVKQLQVASKRKQMGAEVKTRLISLAYLAQIQELLNKQNEYAKRLVTIAEQAEKNGLMLHQDFLEAKIKAQEIDIAVKTVQEQYSNVLLGIQKLTGNYDLTSDQLQYIPDEKAMIEFAALDRSELMEKALAKDQDSLLMLESLKNIQELATKIANASVYWKPDFALKATIGYGGSRFPFIEKDWYRKDDYTANFTLAFKTTIWDGGKKLNEIQRSESKEEIAKITYDDSVSTIQRTLTEQFNAMDLCMTKIEYQKLKMETLDSKIKQQEKLHRSGVGSEQDLIQAKIDRTTAEIDLLQEQLKLAAAVNTAQFLTGK